MKSINEKLSFCSKMDLDLVPRIDGEVVSADSTSVVELYKVVSMDTISF